MAPVCAGASPLPPKTGTLSQPPPLLASLMCLQHSPDPQLPGPNCGGKLGWQPTDKTVTPPLLQLPTEAALLPGFYTLGFWEIFHLNTNVSVAKKEKFKNWKPSPRNKSPNWLITGNGS